MKKRYSYKKSSLLFALVFLMLCLLFVKGPIAGAAVPESIRLVPAVFYDYSAGSAPSISTSYQQLSAMEDAMDNLGSADVFDHSWFPLRTVTDNSIVYNRFDSTKDLTRIDGTSGVPGGPLQYLDFFETPDLSNQIFNTDSDPIPGFFPFDDTNPPSNFNFGAKIEVPIVLTDDRKINGQDMVFTVSGSSDIWVYIDNELEIEMRGAGETFIGSINFFSGELSVQQEGQDPVITTFSLDNLTSDSKITIFRIGTGTDVSNFNINSMLLPPRPITSLTMNPSPSTNLNAGANIALQASVAPLSGYETVIPTGSIDFYIGDRKMNPIPLYLVSGIADLPTQGIKGTHSITAVYSGDANYSSTTATITDVEFKALIQSDFEISGGNITKTYGDTHFQLTVTGAKENPTVQWVSSDASCADVDSEGNITILNASDTPITITATSIGDDFYDDASDSVELTINRASLTITPENASIFYMDDLPSITLRYDGFRNNDDARVFTTKPSISVTAPENFPVGTYDVTLSGAEANNYKISYGKGTLTVKPVTSSMVSVANIPVQSYTGKAITPTPTITYKNKTLVAGTDYTVSFSNNTKVGTATATITFKGNYSGTLTKNFSISATTPQTSDNATFSLFAALAIISSIAMVLIYRKLVTRL